MPAEEHIIGLADAIEALRAALMEAADRGRGMGMQFRIEPIELTLQAVVTKDASGKIGWGAIGAGAAYQSATTQTLTLRLKPLWRGGNGTLDEDFTVADQSEIPQHFGPQPRSAEPANAEEGRVGSRPALDGGSN
jgi:hypothetical protein